MSTAEPSVFLVTCGDYEISVESMHSSDASARAWVLAQRLASLKSSLETDLLCADSANEKREARKEYRRRVAEAEAGDLGAYGISCWPVLTFEGDR